MSVKMRAKLVISEVISFETKIERLKLRAVSRADGYPEDGSDENNTFAKFSPEANLEIAITNPDLVGTFKPGESFYLDFTPCND